MALWNHWIHSFNRRELFLKKINFLIFKSNHIWSLETMSGGSGRAKREKEENLFWLFFKLHSLEVENNFHQGQSSTDLP